MDRHKTLNTGLKLRHKIETKSWYRPVSIPLSEDLEHTESSSETDISNFDDAQYRPFRFPFLQDLSITAIMPGVSVRDVEVGSNRP